MDKLPEPEDLAMLRHRFARTIEMWVAYNTFLNREVVTGDDKTCMNDSVVFQTTHTLLVAYYSFVYSLFDPSAVDFGKITDRILVYLPRDAHEARDIVLDQWEKIRIPVTMIRNNIGFHRSSKMRGALLGYQSYRHIHPYSTELIMQALRVFFRRADEVFEASEPYGTPPQEQDTEALMRTVRKLQQYVVDHPESKMIRNLEDLFRDST